MDATAARAVQFPLCVCFLEVSLHLPVTELQCHGFIIANAARHLMHRRGRKGADNAIPHADVTNFVHHFVLTQRWTRPAPAVVEA